MSHYRLLIPTTNPSRCGGTLRLASAFLTSDDSCGTLLGIVEVPAERSGSNRQDTALAYRTLLSQIDRHAKNGRGPLDSQVRIAHLAAQGVREAALETGANLLLLDAMTNSSGKTDGQWTNAIEDLLFDPPCDVALVRPDTQARKIKRVLLAVRGGPNAELALRLAATVCKSTGAALCLLHVFSPNTLPDAQAREEDAFQRLEKLAGQLDVPFRRLTVASTDVREAIVREAANHQVTILGATLGIMHRPMVLGTPLTRLLRQFPGTVMVVKRRGQTEGLSESELALRVESRLAVGQRVDRWFMENTFHNREFAAVKRLLDLKQRHRLAISLGIPTHNHETTIGRFVRTFKEALMERLPLLDEIVVIDSASSDRTVQMAEAQGATVVRHAEILPRYGSFPGKGEALWKSLHVLVGDLICWLDPTAVNPHPKLIYGLLGPLLTDPEIHFVKGFYRQPLKVGEIEVEVGDRVTELTARPLLNLFFPELSGLIQPLSGEFAGRRRFLESVPFFTGYGMELSLLLAISEAHGLKAIAQVDLGTSRDREGDLFELSKRAFAIVQVGLKRLGDRHRIHLLEEINNTMKLIHYDDERFWIEPKDIDDQERPAMDTVPEYFLARYRTTRET